MNFFQIKKKIIHFLRTLERIFVDILEISCQHSRHFLWVEFPSRACHSLRKVAIQTSRSISSRLESVKPVVFFLREIRYSINSNTFSMHATLPILPRRIFSRNIVCAENCCFQASLLREEIFARKPWLFYSQGE